MKYTIKRTTQFKKDFKQIMKRNLDLKKIEYVIQLLADGKEIPKKYSDHPLVNSKYYNNCRELHIEPDWLLVYKYQKDDLILILSRTGTHSDLF